MRTGHSMALIEVTTRRTQGFNPIIRVILITPKILDPSSSSRNPRMIETRTLLLTRNPPAAIATILVLQKPDD